MRASFSSISNITQIPTIDEGLKRSIRQAKDKLSILDHDLSKQPYDTFGRQSNAVSRASKVQSRLSIMLKQNCTLGPNKLITFANNYDSKDKYQTQNVKKEVFVQKIKLLEEANIQLQDLVCHLKQQNARLRTQANLVQNGLSRLSPIKSRRSSVDQQLKIIMLENQRSLELKEKIIFQKQQQIKVLTIKLKQIEFLFKKLQTQYSTLQMKFEKNKQKLKQQLKNYEFKLSMRSKQFQIAKKLVPNIKQNVRKQSDMLLKYQQQNFKLNNQICKLKIQLKTLRSKMKIYTKQNTKLRRKQDQMEDQFIKAQIETQNIIKSTITNNQSTSIKKAIRRSFGTSSARSIASYKSTSKISRRSSIPSISNH